MTTNPYLIAGGIVALFAVFRKVQVRLRLSRAKHPSLRGHARLSRRLARLVPFYEYDPSEAFGIDAAPADIVQKRRAAFERLGNALSAKSARTLEESRGLEPGISDMQFTNANRVPFQFRELVREKLPVGAVADATDGVRIRDLDGNWSYDVGGSYGVNLLGYDFYKRCIEKAVDRVRDLGPVLGPYHPVIEENVAMIRQISGLDEVSFHMSGTEAVMQAVRLARYNTRRPQLVVFCGAYHGWWDGVQAGVGHGRPGDDIYMLKDMSADTLKVLRTRNDIACVLVNPLQALHPNSGASSDAMLINSERSANFDRDAYAQWLREVREVCTERSIALIFDEVFVGFRLGTGGAQEYFGVRADMVTYGKTIGGGLPIGVLAGKSELMKRFRDRRPTDICFARGTFNSHPYVMASMNEFLRHATSPEFREAIDAADMQWSNRASALNEKLARADLPVRVHNMSSIWIVTYTAVSRYNWIFQYYLRAEGLSLSWVGTGRLIFSHNYSDEDFAEVAKRFVSAAQKMLDDGWWSQHAATTNDSIRKQVLTEMLRARLKEPNAPAPPPGRLDPHHAGRGSSDR
jgi:glutamate-1-semialdehyde 2,1-aminomutase